MFAIPRYAARMVLALALIGAGAWLAAAPRAFAQDVVRIAAVVNDDVITLHDLESRMRLAIVSSGMADTTDTRRRLVPQVLRMLIEERLKLQEGARHGISVTDEELAAGVRQLEERNNLPPGGLERALAGDGIDFETLRAQVRAQILWLKVVQRVLLGRVTVDESEVDEVLARVEASQDQDQLLLAEIFLAVDSPENEPEVRSTANRLAQQVAQGANFAGLARQFSQSASAATGGDLGWVHLGQLPPAVDRIIQTLSPGEMSPPIRSDAGYHLVVLRDKRKPGGAQDGMVRLSQIMVPLTPDTPAEVVSQWAGRLGELTADVVGCAALEARGKEIEAPMSGSLGTVATGALPDHLRAMVQALPLERPSQPIVTEMGIQVLMVCERQAPPEESVAAKRARIAENLRIERLEMHARRLLRELNRAAFLDIRI